MDPALDAATQGAYAQLLSVGVLWITIHCAGMCGPLVVGLQLGGPRAGLGRGVGHVLLYQAGKASAYALYGAAAGGLGAVVAQVLPAVTPWLSGALGLGLLARALWPRGRKELVALGGRNASSPLARLVARAGPALGAGTGLRSFGLGALLSVLPCAVVAWALTLAASTQHPLHGAFIMVLLAVMTSVPLGVVGALPALLGPRSGVWLRGAQRVLLPVSGVWLMLVSAAALGLVPHVSWAFHLWGRPFMMMFF